MCSITNKLKKAIDEDLVKSNYFHYGIGIDDINALRDQGHGMHEAKRMLQISRLTDAVCALDESKEIRCLLKEILTLLK